MVTKDSRFLYVQTIIEDTPKEADNIRFQHTFVSGRNDDEAYRAGREFFAARGFKLEDGEIASDYVVELGPPRE